LSHRVGVGSHAIEKSRDDGALMWVTGEFFNGLATFLRIGGTRFAGYAAKCEVKD
jgi:hypothetical protein